MISLIWRFPCCYDCSSCYQSFLICDSSTASFHRGYSFTCSWLSFKLNKLEIPTWCCDHAAWCIAGSCVRTVWVFATFFFLFQETLHIGTLSSHFQLHVAFHGCFSQLADCVVPIADLKFGIPVAIRFGIHSSGVTDGTLKSFYNRNKKFCNVETLYLRIFAFHNLSVWGRILKESNTSNKLGRF